MTSEISSPVRRYLPFGAGALAAAALIVATVFGIQWWVASGDDNVALAQARDQVVSAGGTAIRAYLDLDYTNPDGYFGKQIELSDSTMQNQVRSLEANARTAMAASKTKVTSTVLDAGVEELNEHDGKASLLAEVSYVVTSQGQPPATKMQRLEVLMTRVGNDWKVSGIDAVSTLPAAP